MEKVIKYPVGIQTFEEIRRDGYVYVDKTDMIYNLVNTSKYIFLSRPRRFGKSLLMSTIDAYFSGRKDLFAGLAIESLEKEWKKYPVLHFDLSGENYDDLQRLKGKIELRLRELEAIYGFDPENKSIATRFDTLIKKAKEKAGEKVVILIDEYDKPLQDSIGEDALQKDLRNELKGFYSVMKSCDAFIRFGMLTGVSRFGEVSVFSGLNNLKDISFSKDYNAICGISESEFKRDFVDSVRNFAKANDMTEQEVWDEFKKNYDGYHFCASGEGIYNPFSVLYAFDEKEIGQYWFTSGTPNFLIEVLKANNYPLSQLEGASVPKSKLTDISEPASNYLALFYQAGYLTIKDYDPRFKYYILGFPNEEVKSGFWGELYDKYVFKNNLSTATFDLRNFVAEVEKGEPEKFMDNLESLVALISPGVDKGKEVHFQNVMQIVFRMLGFIVETEVTIASGRCDMVVKTASYVYVMEFKINDTAEAAITQIREKNYALPYKSDPRTVFLIGASFDTKTSLLGPYLVEKE